MFDENDETIIACTKAIELNPKDFKAYSNRGIAHEAKGNVEQAITDHTRAIELNPNFSVAYNNRGIVYGNAGNHDQAILDYTKAIELEPKFSEAYHNRGIAHNANGNVKQAVTDYTKAIELNPKYAAPYNNRALHFREIGDFDQAISDYTKAIELNPKHYHMAYYNRGLTYALKGNFDLAISDFIKSNELNRNSQQLPTTTEGVSLLVKAALYNEAQAKQEKNKLLDGQDKSAFNFQQFLKGYEKGEFTVLVNKARAGDFVMCKYGNKYNKPAHLFWTWLGIIMVFSFPVVLWFFLEWKFSLACFALGLVICSAAQKSAGQFVLQNMLEDEFFCGFVLIKGGAIIRDKNGREVSLNGVDKVEPLKTMKGFQKK